MSIQPIFVGGYREEATQFVPGYDIRPRPIWTPGLLGSRVHAIAIATNDPVDNAVQFYIGKKITDDVVANGIALVDGGAGNDTITRTAGSFLTDGWLVGQRLAVLGATTLANDFEVIVSTVATSILGLPTSTIDTAEVLPEGAALYRLSKLTYANVPIGAGEPAVPTVSALDPAFLPSLDTSPDRFLTIGNGTVLFAAATTAMGAGEVLDVTVFGGDY